jgi:hypothetical protein
LTTNDNDVNKQGGPSTVVVTGSGPAFQVGIEYIVHICRA